MRCFALAVLVLLALAATAFAVTTSHAPDVKIPGSHADAGSDAREGGEDIATALPITSLPFSDTGSTCGHVDDYDEVCPYGGSTSPDVVYSYYTTIPIDITIDLCDSQYDTKVYIYEDAAGNLVACNDDADCGYSGYQSELLGVALAGGHTYYIVVDGYGAEGGRHPERDCGNYVIEVSEYEPCVLECPPGALIEQEPWCYDDYVDVYNGGCNSSPNVFESIAPSLPGQMITLCGTSGTYLYSGSSYRDTDWFQLNVVETQTITACCTAEFPLQFFFIYGADCGGLQYLSAAAGACQEVCLSYTMAAASIAWIWIGPQVFSGVPCGSDYILTLDGYVDSSPVEGATWGRVKALYR